MKLTRRHLLHRSALLTGAPVLGGLFPSMVKAADTLHWQELGLGLSLVTGAGGNVLVLNGSDGVAMIDGGSEATASALLALVQTKTGKQPTLLFNSHCHRDQIGCNSALGKSGARIVAHENTKLWLGTTIESKWEEMVYPPLEPSALPNQTFYYDSETIHFNEAIEFGYLPQAHTDGDIYIKLPERNLLFTGGVLSPESYPLLDFSTNGWIGGMINSLQQFLTLADDNTRVFASTGTETTRAAIQKQLDVCLDVADKLGTHLYQGGTWESFLASQPLASDTSGFSDPTLFLYTAYAGTLPRVTDIRRYGARR